MLIGLAAAAALLVAAVGSASAAAPFRGTLDESDSGIDTEVCAAAPWGFPVAFTQREYGFFDVFFDPSGSISMVIVHRTYVATISANGHVLTESDRWETIGYPDGHTVNVGNPVHILGPGGIVQLDAGRLVENPDGSVAFLAGPHPQFLGETFCAALAP
jgi:hypothetical protein